MVAKVSAIMEENTTLRTRPCTTCASFAVTWLHDGINSDEGDQDRQAQHTCTCLCDDVEVDGLCVLRIKGVGACSGGKIPM